MAMSKKEFTRAVIMYAVASLFLIYEMALQMSPSVMAHDLMRDFHANAGILGVMVSAYFYSYAIMQIPSGVLYDHYGPRTLLSIAALLCALGTLFFASTETIFWAAFGRFLMGTGSSFAFVGVLVVADRWFDGKYFAMLVGVTQLMAVVGAVVGEAPIAAGADWLGWRGMMLLMVGVGLILSVVALLVLKNRPDHMHRDVLRPERNLWKHLKQVFCQGQTWALAVYAFTAWGPIIIFAALWGVPYMMQRYDINNVIASLATISMLLGGGVLSPVVGYLSHKLHRRKPLLWIGSALGLVCSSVLFFIPGIPFPVACGILFLMGVGTSMHTLTFAMVQDNNRPTVVATGLGFNNTAVVIGGAVLQPLVGFMVNFFWSGRMFHGIPLYTAENYEFALSVIPMLYLIGLFVSLCCIKETYCKAQY